MDIALIIFPGTNREQDMRDAIESVSGTSPRNIWHKTRHIGDPDLIILPGGFSYGDYLRCGAMAAHSPVMSEIIDKAHSGTPVIGICNGFQILLETRLLPGALLDNKSLRFICKNTWIKASSTNSFFTAQLERETLYNFPVAHGEGSYIADNNTLKSLQDNDQIIFQYCDEKGAINQAANPNGSAMNIAGITNKNRNILGMMPHPENAILDHHRTQDGRRFFEHFFNTLSTFA